MYMTALVAVIVVTCFGIVQYGTRNVKKDSDAESSAVATEPEMQIVEIERDTEPEAMYSAKSEQENASEEGYTHPYDVACERRLTENDLSGMSQKELRLMRNWIFARHGYIFKTADMRTFFEQQPWYEGRYSDVSSMLTEVQMYNVSFIKEHE